MSEDKKLPGFSLENSSGINVLRSKDEIQKAHDIIGGVIKNKVLLNRLYKTLPKKDKEKLSKDDFLHTLIDSNIVLCWVLSHDVGDVLQSRLDSLISQSKKLGYEFKEYAFDDVKNKSVDAYAVVCEASYAVVCEASYAVVCEAFYKVVDSTT